MILRIKEDQYVTIKEYQRQHNFLWEAMKEDDDWIGRERE